MRQIGRAFPRSQCVPRAPSTTASPTTDRTPCRLIWDLRVAAADLGSARAQGLQAVATTFGLARPTHPSHDFAFAQRPGGHEDAVALVQYHFAATGGDAFAQTVLGHRHKGGDRVPQSFEAALLYLQPAAELAADRAASARGLPWVRIRRDPSALYASASPKHHGRQTPSKSPTSRSAPTTAPSVGAYSLGNNHSVRRASGKASNEKTPNKI